RDEAPDAQKSGEWSWGDYLLVLVFFCQAEDGIRGRTVTGVQTCALPISATLARPCCPPPACGSSPTSRSATTTSTSARRPAMARSEERRVGKERRCRWWRGDAAQKSERGRRWRNAGGIRRTRTTNCRTLA